MRRRLWLVDHLLENFRGHFFNHDVVLAEAAREAGLEVDVAGSKHCEVELAKALGVRKIFGRDVRAQPHPFLASSRKGLDLLDRIAGRHYRTDLARALPRDGLRSGDLVFCQVRAPRHLVAWLSWLLSLSRVDQPRVILHLGYHAERFAADTRIPPLLERVSSSGKGQAVRFVTDTARLAEKFEKILRRPVSVVTLAISPSITEKSLPLPKSSLTFASLGNARREKGFPEILEAIDILEKSKASANIRFLLQANFPDARCEAALEKYRRKDSVSLIEGSLSQDQYVYLLASAHAVMLPYHLDIYADRSSGILCEALAAGRPVVMTMGAWMSETVSARGLGWLVPERNPLALARCIEEAACNFETVAERSQSEAAKFRRKFSGRTLVTQLLSIADDVG